MSRFRQLLRANEGITLVEVIAAAVICLLVIYVAGSLMVGSINVFNRGTDINSDDQLCDAVYGFMEDCLDDALGIFITHTQVADGDLPQSLHIRDGHLIFSDNGDELTFLDDDNYDGRYLTFTTALTGTMLTLTVNVYGPEDEPLTSKTGRFRLMNVNLGQKLGAEDESLGNINPYIYFMINRDDEVPTP